MHQLPSNVGIHWVREISGGEGKRGRGEEGRRNTRIAENFRGRKFSQISRFLWQNVKVFSTKFGVGHPLAWQSKQSAKVFSMKILSFTNSRKFSPSKVSRYTVGKDVKGGGTKPRSSPSVMSLTSSSQVTQLRTRVRHTQEAPL